jgi:hypothetical protein
LSKIEPASDTAIKRRPDDRQGNCASRTSRIGHASFRRKTAPWTIETAYRGNRLRPASRYWQTLAVQ